jgi:hypothetical protein
MEHRTAQSFPVFSLPTSREEGSGMIKAETMQQLGAAWAF